MLIDEFNIFSFNTNCKGKGNNKTFLKSLITYIFLDFNSFLENFFFRFLNVFYLLFILFLVNVLKHSDKLLDLLFRYIYFELS